MRRVRVFLSTCHLDRDPTDNMPANLAALCQRCGLLHDGAEHQRRRAVTVRARRALLQRHTSQALDKFLSPVITAVSAVLDGGIEALIQAAESKIASLVAANHVVAQVDSLTDELASLQVSASPGVFAQMAPILQELIASATAGNPVVGQLADLRSQLASLVTSAGPGLASSPQQRVAQGLTKSLRLAQ